MRFINFQLKTPLYVSGTSALFASLEKIHVNSNSKICLPDYYCEEAIINLSYNLINIYDINKKLIKKKNFISIIIF